MIRWLVAVILGVSALGLVVVFNYDQIVMIDYGQKLINADSPQETERVLREMEDKGVMESACAKIIKELEEMGKRLEGKQPTNAELNEWRNAMQGGMTCRMLGY